MALQSLRMTECEFGIVTGGLCWQQQAYWAAAMACRTAASNGVQDSSSGLQDSSNSVQDNSSQARIQDSDSGIHDRSNGMQDSSNQACMRDSSSGMQDSSKQWRAGQH
jgi:hypothetical protein